MRKVLRGRHSTWDRKRGHCLGHQAQFQRSNYRHLVRLRWNPPSECQYTLFSIAFTRPSKTDYFHLPWLNKQTSPTSAGHASYKLTHSVHTHRNRIQLAVPPQAPWIYLGLVHKVPHSTRQFSGLNHSILSLYLRLGNTNTGTLWSHSEWYSTLTHYYHHPIGKVSHCNQRNPQRSMGILFLFVQINQRRAKMYLNP